MSVDKFGRHSKEALKHRLRGPKGEGFNLTSEGDYDIRNKRLKFVQNPIDDGDVVNLKTLKHKAILLYSHGYEAKNKRIQNVAFPENYNDVATKSYVDSKTPLTSAGIEYWSFGNKRLADVNDPKDASDVVNLKYFNENVPLKTEKRWEFENRRLSNVASPKEKADAANVEFLFNNALCRKEKVYEGNNNVYPVANTFDANGSIISNVGDPQGLNDVVTKKYLKDVLADLGYAIYKNINKETNTGRSSLPSQPLQWKNSLKRDLDDTVPAWHVWDWHLYKRSGI